MNKLIYRLLGVFMTFILVIGSPYSTYGLSIPQTQVTMLTGTEGFGANTIGGRDGTVYEVANPNGSGSGNGIPAPSGGYWYRGNTHTHSQLPSTDDRATIAGWYKNAGYDFLLISDHNYDVNQSNYCPSSLTTPTFLMICGVELSESRHATAMGINQYINTETSLQTATTLTINAGGIPILNHPQDPVVSAATFINTIGLNHLELVNGGRLSQTPATEILWDAILSASNGRPVYGVAADDNHYSQSNVGRGWIVVRAQSLTKENILAAVRAGDFYSTTGVILNDYVVDYAAKTITIDSQNGNTITFIGNNGAVLKTVPGAFASYQVTGAEKYVRAKITNTAGKAAWTQPIFVTSFFEITPSPTLPQSSPTHTPTPTRTPTPTSTSIFKATSTRTPLPVTTILLPSIGFQDGWILESGENSNMGGSLNSTATTFRLGDDAAKKQSRGILSFNTGASLPDDAVITKVTLKVKMQSIVGIGNPIVIFRGFMADIKKGTFGAATLQASDFQTAASKSYGPFMTAIFGGWYSIDLTSGKAYINKLSTLSGLTQIRLRFQLDDNNNAVANYLSLYSGNAPAASRPQLIIKYYVP
jgi:hypothetical protein